MARKLVIGAVGMVVGLAGCQLTAVQQQQLGAVAGEVAQYECSRLAVNAAKTQICLDASGVAITVAQAQVQGLTPVLPTKKP